MIEDYDRQIAAEEVVHDEGRGPVLMESGSIRPAGDDCGEYRVSRGMPAISTDGHEVGWVAGVELDAAGKSTGAVMARPQTMLEYYYLPLHLIGSVNDGQVRLRIRAEVARSLPRRNAGSKPE